MSAHYMIQGVVCVCPVKFKNTYFKEANKDSYHENVLQVRHTMSFQVMFCLLSALITNVQRCNRFLYCTKCNISFQLA